MSAVRMAINFVTFNQNSERLAVGTTKGFRIHEADSDYTWKASSDEDNISIIEMMYSTQLVALVTSPRRLIIRNTMKKSTICEFTYPSAILAVRLNRKRLIVVLEEEMFIYDILHMNLVYTIATSPNPNAICALSANENNGYLIYPLPKAQEEASSRPSHAPPSSKFVPPTSGELLIFDADSLKNINVVEAHRAPLSCVALNDKGTLMATASDTGTIIRVFSVPDGQKLYQFRRGTYPATIYNMSFNPTPKESNDMRDTKFLAVSSTTDTIHIFKLGAPIVGNSRPVSPQTASSRLSRAISNDRDNSESPPPESYENSPQRPPPVRKSSGTLGSMFRRTSQMMGKNVAGVVGNYLPQAMTEMFEPARDFAFIKLGENADAGKPLEHVRTVVAISQHAPAESIDEQTGQAKNWWNCLAVYVATSDGTFYEYAMDKDASGKASFVRKENMLNPASRKSRRVD